MSDCSVSMIDGIFGNLPGAVLVAFWSRTDCEEHLFEMRYILIVHWFAMIALNVNFWVKSLLDSSLATCSGLLNLLASLAYSTSFKYCLLMSSSKSDIGSSVVGRLSRLFVSNFAVVSCCMGWQSCFIRG